MAIRSFVVLHWPQCPLCEHDCYSASLSKRRTLTAEVLQRLVGYCHLHIRVVSLTTIEPTKQTALNIPSLNPPPQATVHWKKCTFMSFKNARLANFSEINTFYESPTSCLLQFSLFFAAACNKGLHFHHWLVWHCWLINCLRKQTATVSKKL